MSFLRPLASPSRSFPLSHTSRMFSTTRTCSMSKITLIGRLAAQPELVANSSGRGRDIVKYALATSHGTREDPKTSWWRVSHYTSDGQAHKVKDLLLSLGKGTMLYVEGNVIMTRYENKDGNMAAGVNIAQTRLEVMQKREVGETTEGEEEQHQEPE